MAASSKPPQGKTFSSRLKGMKFMQRAEEKKTLAAATKRKREDSDEARWAVDSGADSFAARRCVVLVENDPPPGALLGRMSFQSFSAATERLQSEAEELFGELRQRVAVKGEEGEEAGQPAEGVTDEEMTQRVKKRRRKDNNNS